MSLKWRRAPHPLHAWSVATDAPEAVVQRPSAAVDYDRPLRTARRVRVAPPRKRALFQHRNYRLTVEDTDGRLGSDDRLEVVHRGVIDADDCIVTIDLRSKSFVK
eukprot:207901-Prymnesium_polylepis.2